MKALDVTSSEGTPVRRGPRGAASIVAGALAAALNVAGLVVVAAGLAKALPIVFSGGDAELSSIAEGEQILPVGAALLLAGGALFLARRSYTAAVAATITGVVPVWMVLSDDIPGTNGEFLFFVLAPASLALALTSALNLPRARPILDLAERVGAPRAVVFAARAATCALLFFGWGTAYGMVAGPVGAAFAVPATVIFAATWWLCAGAGFTLSTRDETGAE